MSRLTDAQQLLLQKYIDKALAELEEAGLTFHVESDLADWVAFMKTAPGITAVSPTLDPDESDVRPANSFWVNLRDDHGRIVACAAHRLFETDDFVALVRSYKLFYDKKPLLHYRPLQIVAPLDAPLLSGRIGYGGGHWVHPEYRGRALSGYMPRLHRALGLRHFDFDWFTGLVREKINADNEYGRKVGVPHKFICLKGYFPPHGRDGDYGIIYMTRHEVLAELGAAAEAPSPLKPGAGYERVPAVAAE